MTRTLFLAAVLTAIAAPAMASETINRSREVRHGDLDLATSAGAKRLEARLGSAIAKVCDSGAPINDLVAMRSEDRCRKATWSNVRPQLDLAVARARSGKALASAEIAVTSAP